MSASRRAALPAAIVLVLSLAGASRASDELIQATASDQFVWYVLADYGTPPEAALFLHAVDAGGPYRERLRAPMPDTPVHIAASGEDLWMSFVGRKGGYEVFTIRVQREPNLGRHLTIPADRLAIEPPVTVAGEMRSFVATAGGPAALMVDPEGGASLLELRAGRWQRREPLPDLEPGRDLVLGTMGTGDSDSLVLIETASDGLVLHLRQRDGTWERREIPGATTPVLEVVTIGGRPAVLTRPAPGRLRLSYLRAEGLLPLATFDEPEDPWAVAGLPDGVRLLASTPAGVVRMARIDPISGAAEPAVELKLPAVPAFQLLQGALFLVIAVLALLIVIVFRPEKRSAVVLPSKLEPVPPIPRLLALAVDLVPGGVLSLLILRAPPSELASLPMLTANPADSMAYLLMVTITVVHATVFELVGGASIGKLLFGARVVGQTGEAVGAGRLLIRAALKFVVLLIPPLAVLAVFNPNLQGIGDIVARTAVVQVREPGEMSGSE